MKKFSLKQFWLNRILHLSSLIYKAKNQIVYAGIIKTIFLGILVIVLEILLSIISLPFYFLIGIDRATFDFKGGVQAFKLRQRITIGALVAFLGVQIATGIFTFSGATEASSWKWDFSDANQYVTDSPYLKIEDGKAVFDPTSSLQNNQNSKNKKVVSNQLCTAKLEAKQALAIYNIKSWNSFTQAATTGKGEIYYQLSLNNGLDWIYFDGRNWARTLSDQYSTRQDINKNISSLSEEDAKVLFRAYFENDCTQVMKLDSVAIQYIIDKNAEVKPTPPEDEIKQDSPSSDEDVSSLPNDTENDALPENEVVPNEQGGINEDSDHSQVDLDSQGDRQDESDESNLNQTQEDLTQEDPSEEMNLNNIDQEVEAVPTHTENEAEDNQDQGGNQSQDQESIDEGGNNEIINDVDQQALIDESEEASLVIEDDRNETPDEVDNHPESDLSDNHDFAQSEISDSNTETENNNEPDPISELPEEVEEALNEGGSEDENNVEDVSDEVIDEAVSADQDLTGDNEVQDTDAEDEGEVPLDSSLPTIPNAPTIPATSNQSSGGGGGGKIKLIPIAESEKPNIPLHEVATPKIDLPLIFSDLEGHWAKPYVEKMQAVCDVEGYPDPLDASARLFKPNQNISRSELVAMILKCNRVSLSSPREAPFVDVVVGVWHTPYIDRAKELDIVSGYTDGFFRPANPATRAEALKIILLSKLSNEGLSRTQPGYNVIDFCEDLDQNVWYTPYFAAALKNKIVSGYTDAYGKPLNECRPQNQITRAEAAKMIINLNELHQ